MKRVSWLLAVALTAAIAVPALAGGGGKCSEEAQACLNHMSSYKARGYMGVELDKTEAGATVIARVLEDTTAASAGFQAGDVLVARNGIKMSDSETIQKDKDSFKAGAKVTYTVERKGKELKLAVTLVEMPETVFSQMVGRHMIEAHMQVATAENTLKK